MAILYLFVYIYIYIKIHLEKVVATPIDIGIASISYFHPEEFMTHTIHVYSPIFG